MADYESACWKSMRENFPGMQMHGCLFHFSQAINRKVISYGLFKDYKTAHSTIRNLIKGVYSLPYLPPRDMSPAFETLKSQASEAECENYEKLQDFFRYVNKTWFQSSTWKATHISAYQRMVRTNNDLEGYHNRLNIRSCSSNSPKPIADLIKVLYEEAKLVKIRYKQISSSNVMMQRSKDTEEDQAKLCAIWDKYDNDEISREQLMEDCVQFCAF